MGVYSGCLPADWDGQEIELPVGHEIIGMAIASDKAGFVTWIDLKTWRPPIKTNK
jgi:hypothetical protein